MTGFREWWNTKSRVVEQRSAREARQRHQQTLAGTRRLQDLTDDELIAEAPARTTLSHPRHEMEMQRRLKDSIERLAKETAKARWWAFWGAVVIGILTAVIVALTVVLAIRA